MVTIVNTGEVGTKHGKGLNGRRYTGRDINYDGYWGRSDVIDGGESSRVKIIIIIFLFK